MHGLRSVRLHDVREIKGRFYTGRAKTNYLFNSVHAKINLKVISGDHCMHARIIGTRFIALEVDKH